MGELAGCTLARADPELLVPFDLHPTAEERMLGRENGSQYVHRVLLGSRQGD